MNRATRALLLVAALASAANADSHVAPRGWTLDETMSIDLSRKAQAGSFFGGTATKMISVAAYLAPTGGSLFVTRADATPTADIRDGVATRALFALVQNAQRYGLAEIETTTQNANPATKTLEANLTWRDPKAGIRQVGRTIVAADANHLVALTGECMLPVRDEMDAAAAKATETACLASLASLDPGIALDQRVALAMVGATAETPEPPAPAPPVSLDRPQTAQPSMADGARTPIAPMTISPAKREVDRRPLYLGGGIVVLAALFWWNRRRRDLFDREDGVTPAKPEPEATSGGDDDADDLQAAARGDAPKDES